MCQPTTPYVYSCPAKLPWRKHFSSLLFSGDVFATVVELLLLVLLTVAGLVAPHYSVQGSMPLAHLAAFFWAKTVFTRLYNSYCEACFFYCPEYRTQPAKERELKTIRDLCGRDEQQLEQLVAHDMLTLLSQYVLNLAIYFAIPGWFPDPAAAGHSLPERVVRLFLNHYVLSFGMYWMHRALHVVPWLWKHIHSVHHWAKHPLSRNTYQDHWLDNFMNAIVGHGFAQVLVPLDFPTFLASHFFRVMESLEKHSGVSCWLNLAHQTQRYFPYAQMPHHHDWHHEGHKGSNYTFSSIGGLWDAAFGTRKTGRANLHPSEQTPLDKKLLETKERRG